MTAFAALIYGFLASFVLSAAGNNQRKARQHSQALLRMGYVLCGVSAGACAILSYIVIREFV
jgi:Na+/melibiose symporter-like transporter